MLSPFLADIYFVLWWCDRSTSSLLRLYIENKRVCHPTQQFQWPTVVEDRMKNTAKLLVLLLEERNISNFTERPFSEEKLQYIF